MEGRYLTIIQAGLEPSPKWPDIPNSSTQLITLPTAISNINRFCPHCQLMVTDIFIMLYQKEKRKKE